MVWQPKETGKAREREAEMQREVQRTLIVVWSFAGCRRPRIAVFILITLIISLSMGNDRVVMCADCGMPISM